MKTQALFSSKDKDKKLKCHLLQFLFGALKVNKGILPDFIPILMRSALGIMKSLNKQISLYIKVCAKPMLLQRN